jgi:SAM-dependent methyltransferase
MVVDMDWEAKYQANDAYWDHGAASPGLIDFLAAHADLPTASVLVPGCGTGHDVRAWAKAGWRAVGMDIAPTAVALARERTDQAGLSAEFHVGDFLHDHPQGEFDWVFEHTLFCAINPTERDEYVKALLRWLQPAGWYLAVNYMITEGEGPPFNVTRQELWDRFAPSFELLAEWEPTSYPQRTGRERMFWWRRKTTPSAALPRSLSQS